MRESAANSTFSPKKSFADNVLTGILRDLPDAVLMIDPEGCIYYANPAAEKLFGFVNGAKRAPEFSDIYGLDVIEVWPKDYMADPEAFRPVAEHCGLEFNGDAVRAGFNAGQWHG